MNDTAAQPNAPEAQAEQTRSGRWTWILWCLFFLFVVYPLSIGPAARLHKAAPSARPAIEAVYAPITLVCNHSKPIQEAFEWYLMNVWRFPSP